MRLSLKNGVIPVTVNQLLAEAAILARNVLLARLLGPEEMAKAIMLGIVLRCIEMLSYMAVDRLLVQAKDGNTSRFQSSAHGMEIARGLLSGLLLASTAYPTAMAFGYAELTWAFAILGLAPAIKGFMHLDYRRVQRQFSYLPSLAVEASANLLSTAAVLPLWYLTRDFSAFVWACLLQALAQTVASHLIARRPYRVRFEKSYWARMIRFGWPLLVNSLVMAGVFQGDRLVVALAVSAEELSRYALALQLGLIPTMILARASLALFLPVLARQTERPASMQSDYSACMTALALLSCCFIALYGLAGNFLLATLFGDPFTIDGHILSILGLALAVRVLRIGPGTASLAQGDSQALMLANLARATGLLAAAGAALAGQDLAVIVGCAALGEIMALGTAVRLLVTRQNIRTSLAPIAAVFTASAVVITWLNQPIEQSTPGLSLVVAASLVIIFAYFTFQISPKFFNGARR